MLFYKLMHDNWTGDSTSGTGNTGAYPVAELLVQKPSESFLSCVKDMYPQNMS